MTTPAVLAVAGHPVVCLGCGDRIEPGTVVADFRDGGGDVCRWRCPACTEKHVRRQARR